MTIIKIINRSGRIRTDPVWILSPLPLPLGYTPFKFDNHKTEVSDCQYQPRVTIPPKGRNLRQIVYKTTLNTCSDWQ